MPDRLALASWRDYLPRGCQDVCSQTHSSRIAPMELHFSMAAILQIDPYHAVISQIAAFGNASVSVPALSKLLGVKSATLNARFRRLQIHLRTAWQDQLSAVPASSGIGRVTPLCLNRMAYTVGRKQDDCHPSRDSES